MKRVLVVFVIGAILSVVLAEMFPDVPEDHWAYIYVKNLYSKGIVIGYPDGTFKGEQPATRYEVAAIIARMYDAIEARLLSVIKEQFKDMEKSMEKGIEGGGGECAGCEYIPNILEMLNSLSIQLQIHEDKLAELFDKIDKISTPEGAASVKVEQLEKEIEQLKKALDVLNLETSTKIDEIEKLMDLINSLKGEYGYIPNMLEMLNDLSLKIQAHDQALEDIYANLKSMRKEIEEKVTGDVQNKIENLAGEASELSGKIDSLKKAVSEIEKDLGGKVSDNIKSLKEEIEKLKMNVSALKQTIKDVAEIASQNKIDELQNKQLSKINLELMKVWASIKNIESKMKNLNASDKVKQLESALNNVKIDLAGITSTLFEVARMATFNSNAVKGIEELKEKIKELSENIAIVNGDVMRLYRISGDLQRKVISLEKNFKDMNKVQDEDIAKLYDLANDLYNEIYSIKAPVSKIDRIESSVFGNAKLLKFIYEKLDKDEDAIRANAKSVEELSSKIESVKKELQDEISQNADQFQTTVEFLYDEIDSLKSQAETLRAGLFALREDSEAEIKSVKDSIDEIQTKLKTIESINSAQDRDIYTLYQSTNELDKKLSEKSKDLETWKWINLVLALTGIAIGGYALYVINDH